MLLKFILLQDFCNIITFKLQNELSLCFLNYANETIQCTRESITQSDDLNFLELQKEQLELLISMFNQLLSNINKNNEIIM